MSNVTIRPIKLDNARIVDPSRKLDGYGALLAINGVIVACGADALSTHAPEGTDIIDCKGKVVIPGLVDVGVFVGEPGAEHRETLATASQAAARGGVTTILTMPDTDPVIDDIALVDFILRRARDTAVVRVHPLAALTEGLQGEQMTEIGLLSEAGAVAFTNGRHAIRNSAIMMQLMTYAKSFDMLIIHQVQDPDLAKNGVTHSGFNATRAGLSGIPREAETIMIDRDLRLVAKTGVRYHAAYLSTREGVETIRKAKAQGLNISAGVTINHLSLNENDIGTWRSFFKMSPPLRSEDDRQALIEGVADGTIDIIVSAHDPQDVEMKRHPFAESADGAVGLETMLAAGLRLVHDERISLLKLIELMSTAPAKRLKLNAGSLAPGKPADCVVIDLDRPWVLDRHALASRSKNSTFEDARFTGGVERTYVAGCAVYVRSDVSE